MQLLYQELVRFVGTQPAEPPLALFVHPITFKPSYRPQLKPLDAYPPEEQRHLVDVPFTLDVTSPGECRLLVEHGYYAINGSTRRQTPWEEARTHCDLYLTVLEDMVADEKKGSKKYKALLKVDDTKVPFLERDPDKMWSWRLDEDDRFECAWCQRRKEDAKEGDLEASNYLWGGHVRIWVRAFTHVRMDLCGFCCALLTTVWTQKAAAWPLRSNPLPRPSLERACKRVRSNSIKI